MRILIAAPVRQKKEIFAEYLKAIDNLEKPANCEVDRFFIFHNSPDLIPLVKCNYGVMTTKDELNNTERMHDWDWEKICHVIKMKNAILDYARARDYDYLLFVDSDLILHPKTLTTLIEANKDIIAECFWTRWTPEDVEAPNAWDYDVYDIKHKNRWQEWRNPGLYQIGGTGACIMLSKPVIRTPTVNYSFVNNLTMWGEDRHFCVRAAAHEFEIWLDTHYSPIHLYRDSEYEKYMRGELIHATKKRQKQIRCFTEHQN